MTGPFLGYLQNGAPVYDRVQSHIHFEFDGVKEYIEQTLQNIDPQQEVFFNCSHDFGEVIGDSICVSTETGDEIVYAQRTGRDGLTRFVKNKAPRPTSVFTVALKRDQSVEEEQYILISAHAGERAPAEPWAKHVNEDSVSFWDSHALVWGSVPIISGTETIACPW